MVHATLHTKMARCNTCDVGQSQQGREDHFIQHRVVVEQQLMHDHLHLVESDSPELYERTARGKIKIAPYEVNPDMIIEKKTKSNH